MAQAMKIAIVDDEQDMRQSISQWLALSGFDTETFASAEDALKALGPDYPGVVVSDIRMPGRDGLYLLDYAQSVDPELPVILLTGEGDIPMAVGAINKGAYDFLEKPCANDVLLETVGKALKSRKLVLDNRRLRSEITRGDAAARMIFGVSKRAEMLRSCRSETLAQNRLGSDLGVLHGDNSGVETALLGPGHRGDATPGQTGPPHELQQPLDGI